MSDRQPILNRRRAVFLDRDGTLCEDPFQSKAERPVLLPGVKSQMRRLKERGFLLVIISNQGHIAKGTLDTKNVEQFNRRLARMLGEHGAAPDLVLYCPHHPQGVVPSLSIRCDCRKPAPGMLLEAASTLNVDLPASYLVGDYIWDIEAGRSVGCATVGLGSRIPPGAADMSASTFREATELILTDSLRLSHRSTQG